MLFHFCIALTHVDIFYFRVKAGIYFSLQIIITEIKLCHFKLYMIFTLKVDNMRKLIDS